MSMSDIQQRPQIPTTTTAAVAAAASTNVNTGAATTSTATTGNTPTTTPTSPIENISKVPVKPSVDVPVKPKLEQQQQQSEQSSKPPPPPPEQQQQHQLPTPPIKPPKTGTTSSSSSTTTSSATSSKISMSGPVCGNCQTQTTPLWRRDETGQVLCNACGLFLKLHGRPRPISLKTDTIKSRNRVKQNGSNSQSSKSSGANTLN